MSLFFVMAWVVGIVLAGDVAQRKGLTWVTGAFVVGLAGPIGWLYLIAVPITVKEEASRQMYRDAHVAELRSAG